jgi:hypothetical protein
MIGRFVILGLLLAHSAEAAMLCAKPKKDGTFSTSVKVREACTASEVQLDPATLGLQGPSVHGVIVRDGAGQFVGTVLQSVPVPGSTTAPAAMLVVRQVDAELIPFRITIDSVTSAQPIRDVYFESVNCSGTPLVGEFGLSRLLSDGTLVGSTVHYIDQQAVPTLRTLRSRADYLLGPCTSTDQVVFMVPLATATLPSFSPPFRVEIEGD